MSAYDETRGLWLRDMLRSSITRDQAAGTRLAELDREVRAASSSTMTGFQTPIYAAKDYAAGLSAIPSLTKLCMKVEDPGWGLQLNIPSFTTAAGAAVQSAENAVPGGALTYWTGSNVQFGLKTVVAETYVSYQLMDRIDPAAEQVFNDQLGSALMQQVETTVINQVASGANTITEASAASVANVKGDFGEAMSEAVAATNIVPTHIIANGLWTNYLLGLTDATTGGQLVQSVMQGQTYTEPQVGETGQDQTGATGARIGSLELFMSPSIPSATNAQLLAVAPDDIYVLVSDTALRVIPENASTSPAVGAQTLTALVQAYCYVAVGVRRPLAHTVVTGAGYPATPPWV